MQLALTEAARGRGRASPNPMVGCVICRDGHVVAVGHHAGAGGPHAEVVALRRAKAAARGADAYVTLEPCAHKGRTGPCADALIAAGVRRVVVGMRDPNPLVNGRGLRRLREAGITVEVGLLEEKCRALNEAFEFSVRNGRPHVLAKMAQSLDGRIATRTGESQWITGTKARRRGHQLRHRADVIMVGMGTVRLDDPRLTCRLPRHRDPIRVILDTAARLPVDAAVVRVARQSSAPTWVCVGHDAPLRRRRALERAGVETIGCSVRGDRIDLCAALEKLHERQIREVLVEGGPTVLGAFFDAHLVNKVCIFISPSIIGGVEAVASVGGKGIERLADVTRLSHIESEKLGPDWFIEATVKRHRRGTPVR